MALPEDIVIGEHRIKAGQSAKVMLPVAKLYTDAEVSLPVFMFLPSFFWPACCRLSFLALWPVSSFVFGFK